MITVARLLLNIHPTSPRSATPEVDHFTSRLAAAIQGADIGAYGTDGIFRVGTKHHLPQVCACGEKGPGVDYRLDGIHFLVSGLGVHALAYHRTDVPQAQLKLFEDYLPIIMQPANKVDDRTLQTTSR